MSLFHKCLAVHVASATPKVALQKTGSYIVSAFCFLAFFVLLIFAYLST